jgi:hypothetical protein
MGALQQVLAGYGAAAAATDPFFANVSTLLHMNGSPGSTSFPDVKGKTYTAFGTASVTATSKFGSGALDASGTTGNRISTAAHADFNMGTGDFTIELWWSPTTTYAGGIFPTLFSYGYTTAGGLLAQTSTALSGAFTFYINGAGVCTESSGVTVGSGYHFYQFKRSGTTVTIVRDGVQTASGTSSANITNTANLEVGGASSGGGHRSSGFIDDFRITKAVARANVVPTAAFPDS